jgi:hypothetical protein
MQNRYAGDIGDFGKFGLLRAIFPDRQLGIIWYLVPDESHNKNGKHIDYLKKAEFRACDPELFDKLDGLVRTDYRSVKYLQQLILFRNIVFFSDILSYEGASANSEAGRHQRLLIRQKWLNAALKAGLKCEVLFLDPDNGLETKSVTKYSKSAVKYVFLDELREFAHICPCVVVYHHLGRQGTHPEQIRRWIQRLCSHFNETHSVFAMRFKCYSPRAYFFLAREDKADDIKQRIEMFIDSNWNKCFDSIAYHH